MSSFVDGPYTRPRMARPERDEDPDELALLVTRELHDHAEGSLRRGSLAEGQVDLCAARKARAIRTVGLARAGIGQCQAFELKLLAVLPATSSARPENPRIASCQTRSSNLTGRRRRAAPGTLSLRGRANPTRP